MKIEATNEGEGHYGPVALAMAVIDYYLHNRSALIYGKSGLEEMKEMVGYLQVYIEFAEKRWEGME